MVRADTTPADGRAIEVRVPFNGDRILLVHADEVQQVYPPL